MISALVLAPPHNLIHTSDDTITDTPYNCHRPCHYFQSSIEYAPRPQPPNLISASPALLINLPLLHEPGIAVPSDQLEKLYAIVTTSNCPVMQRSILPNTTMIISVIRGGWIGLLLLFLWFFLSSLLLLLLDHYWWAEVGGLDFLANCCDQHCWSSHCGYSRY